MARTIISLENDDKKWLDERARREGVSMAELIRRAVKMLRAHPEGLTTEDLLEKTRGLWKHGDGLAFQESLRDEW